MPRKILDISLIEDNKSDLTFFNIDEEESNETLKALKQSYVTTNYKEETILNLQNYTKQNSEDISKELKIESYKKYNNCLDLAYKNYITSAYNLVDKSLELNPKDIDILNLKGLLSLLKCDFSKAFESFYTSMCYDNNDLSKKYVDMLSSDEFKVFLGRYNHSIRFINEELNQESIHILDNIIQEDPNLIEPYVILSLLYEKLGETSKKEIYLQKLREVDKDNSLFEKTNEEAKDETEKIETKDKKSKNKFMYIIIGALLLLIGIYFVDNKSKIEQLNSQLNEKEQKLDEAGDKISQKEEQIKEKEKELDEAKEKQKEKEKETEVLISDEVELYNKAIQLKKNKDYKGAIDMYKNIISKGKTQKYISESIYQVAFLSESIDDYDNAVKYYKKYINTYTSKEQYYDDSFYQLGMLYYENDKLEDAQSIFYGLKSEVPNSMYNNSKVDGILKER